MTARRISLRLRGVVQGVGFRPFIHRLARLHHLTGQVCNDDEGVLLEVEGAETSIADFLRDLPLRLPPAARLDAVERRDLPFFGYASFAIVESRHGGGRGGLAPADLALCDDCRNELHDPTDRRRGYPFITCTNCGPRYSIIRSLPYDRPATTMAGFPLCPDCRRQYEDPADRRYHAQPLACPVCGPRLWILDPDGARLDGSSDELLTKTVRRLRDGGIVALKGLGGFHLACDATRTDVAARLRQRKQRDERPFALMVPDIATARRIAELSTREEALLRSARAPIVILRRRPDCDLPEILAPGQATLGVMLPYTPLHELLFSHPDAPSGWVLVMTSGNRHDEPIVYRDEETVARLGPLADLTLTHDRPILIRSDDSVVRVIGPHPVLARRSRGWAPDAVALPGALDGDVLGVGAELKNTVCVGRDAEAILGHHVGDVQNLATEQAFREAIGHLESLYGVRPRLLIHDLHPDYVATRYALERARREGLAALAVQHHEAHAAAVMAEYGLTGDLIALCYDGTGLGRDGMVWGSEIFLVRDGEAAFVRAAHLEPVPLAGGDKAAEEPWRQALVVWRTLMGTAPPPVGLRPYLETPAAKVLMHLVDHASPRLRRTTSMGRLFDAVASLCGVRQTVSYEAQAAMELETLAASVASDLPLSDAYPLPLHEAGDGCLTLLLRSLLTDLADDLKRGAPDSLIAARFHLGLTAASLEVVETLSRRTGVRRVGLSGGCFINAALTARLTDELDRRGYDVYIQEKSPVGDGGVALGQVYYAWRLQHVHGHPHETSHC